KRAALRTKTPAERPLPEQRDSRRDTRFSAVKSSTRSRDLPSAKREPCARCRWRFAGRRCLLARKGLSDVVRCGPFLADIGDFDAMNAAYSHLLSRSKARTNDRRSPTRARYAD